jgi:hypothetical protein
MCKDRRNFTVEDISKNRIEIIHIFNSMMQLNSETKYPLYYLYKDSFEKFAFELIDINEMIRFQNEKMPIPPYIEEDKQLTIYRTKSKSKTIIEMFQNVEKI